jgi:hypothetical protein
MAPHLGDSNADGVPDLMVGWSGDPAVQLRNVRVLFGGSR